MKPSRELHNSIFGMSKDIATQLDFNQYDVYYTFKVMAIEEGYPYDVINGVAVPLSLSDDRLTQKDACLLASVIKRFADENSLYIHEKVDNHIVKTLFGEPVRS